MSYRHGSFGCACNDAHFSLSLLSFLWKDKKKKKQCALDVFVISEKLFSVFFFFFIKKTALELTSHHIMFPQPKGMCPHNVRGGGHIVFGADPVGVGVASCLHSIS